MFSIVAWASSCRLLLPSRHLCIAHVQETYMREDKLRTAWNRLDADGNGYLEHDDFKKLCAGMFS